MTENNQRFFSRGGNIPSLVVLQEGDHGLDTTPLLQNTQTQKILFSRGGGTENEMKQSSVFLRFQVFSALFR